MGGEIWWGLEKVEEGKTLIRVDYVKEISLSSIKGKSVSVAARKQKNVLGIS